MECGADVSGNCLMSLLISVVFFDEMKVISSNDERVSHLCRNDNSLEDLSSNGDI